MNKRRAVGYVRVSAEKQIDNTSLKDQKEKIEMYCKLHDIELIDIYKDEAETAKITEQRDNYNRMIEYLSNKENGVTDLVVYKLDRIHRSGKNLLVMVEDILDPVNVAFISVTEQFDTNTPQGKLFLTMMGGFAEFERTQINSRTRGGRLATAKKHAHAGGAIAYGYRLIDKETFTLVVESEEASIVKEIFETRAEGKSLSFIANSLNTSNKLHNGKSWSKQTISYILNNETYLGKYSYDGKKERNGIAYQVPKIVSKQLWNKSHK